MTPDDAIEFETPRLLVRGQRRGALRDNADGTQAQLFAWVPPG